MTLRATTEIKMNSRPITDLDYDRRCPIDKTEGGVNGKDILQPRGAHFCVLCKGGDQRFSNPSPGSGGATEPTSPLDSSATNGLAICISLPAVAIIDKCGWPALTRPNGINTSYSYNNVSNLLSVLHEVGTTTLDGASYTGACPERSRGDLAGNRKTRTDKRLGTTLTYAYDNIYQLLTAKQGTTTKESYTGACPSDTRVANR
jgi:hypothetical protein